MNTESAFETIEVGESPLIRMNQAALPIVKGHIKQFTTAD